MLLYFAVSSSSSSSSSSGFTVWNIAEKVCGEFGPGDVNRRTGLMKSRRSRANGEYLPTSGTSKVNSPSKLPTCSPQNKQQQFRVFFFTLLRNSAIAFDLSPSDRFRIYHEWRFVASLWCNQKPWAVKKNNNLHWREHPRGGLRGLKLVERWGSSVLKNRGGVSLFTVWLEFLRRVLLCEAESEMRNDGEHIRRSTRFENGLNFFLSLLIE